MSLSDHERLPLYQKIAHALREEIQRSCSPRQKLPSDNELCQRYNTSRLTIIKSMRQLEREGLVIRRAGSGTFVHTEPKSASHNFGLLIPDLGSGEIFEPICRGMASAGPSPQHSLLWGNVAGGATGTRAERTRELCRDFIQKKVSGVFFAPLELDPLQEEVNAHVVAQLKHAGIPVVFLDREIASLGHEREYDLVGIDNWREGFRMSNHVLDLGARRVGFVTRPGSAPTVDARIAGLNHALWLRGISLQTDWVLRGDPSDRVTIETWYERVKPDAILCGNDLTAAELMQVLLSLGVGIPDPVRLVGFDDVKYAKLLPIPLTTLRQPCQQIGEVAIHTMLERIAQPFMPPRTISLTCEIVIRDSCGGRRVSIAASSDDDEREEVRSR